MKLLDCNKKVLCIDCDVTKCMHHGKIEADCPKYHCDNERLYDCANCNFIKKYQERIRKEYPMKKTVYIITEFGEEYARSCALLTNEQDAKKELRNQFEECIESERKEGAYPVDENTSICDEEIDFAKVERITDDGDPLPIQFHLTELELSESQAAALRDHLIDKENEKAVVSEIAALTELLTAKPQPTEKELDFDEDKIYLFKKLYELKDALKQNGYL